MNPSRTRGTILLVLVVATIVLLVAVGMQWAGVVVQQPAALTLSATGQTLVPVASAAGVVLLGAIGALLLARGWGRRILGALVALAGAGLAADIAFTLPALVKSPQSVAALALQHAGLGIGDAALGGVRAEWSVWPVVAFACAVVAVAGGILVLVTARLWPAAQRRFERTAPADASPSSTWDALSDGDDPTARA